MEGLGMKVRAGQPVANWQSCSTQTLLSASLHHCCLPGPGGGCRVQGGGSACKVQQACASGGVPSVQ